MNFSVPIEICWVAEASRNNRSVHTLWETELQLRSLARYGAAEFLGRELIHAPPSFQHWVNEKEIKGGNDGLLLRH